MINYMYYVMYVLLIMYMLSFIMLCIINNVITMFVQFICLVDFPLVRPVNYISMLNHKTPVYKSVVFCCVVSLCVYSNKPRKSVSYLVSSLSQFKQSMFAQRSFFHGILFQRSVDTAGFPRRHFFCSSQCLFDMCLPRLDSYFVA